MVVFSVSPSTVLGSNPSVSALPVDSLGQDELLTPPSALMYLNRFSVSHFGWQQSKLSNVRVVNSVRRRHTLP